ncbi:MAG TPA: deoxyribose-phosphate aldolase [Nitrospira sp.]|nr:deoxyribose-phosphate aldolase [Nitrospira sp.]
MNPRDWNLPALIDHTILRPEATRADVLRLCKEAKDNQFRVIFVPPCYAAEAVEAVAGSAVRVGIPVGFPLGGHGTSVKVAEALDGVKQGAAVLDMVINVSRLKSGDLDAVRQDIAEVVRATPSAEHKVILETCYLSEQEKITACRLVVEAGADYVKTSTGFAAGGATVADVRLLTAAVSGRAKVKASGGIRDWKTAREMLEAGADRIGTSASLKILEEWSAARHTLRSHGVA